MKQEKACDLEKLIFIDMNNAGSFMAGPPCFNSDCDDNPWKVIGSLSSGADGSRIIDIEISGRYVTAVAALVGQEGNTHVHIPDARVTYSFGKIVRKHVEKRAPYALITNQGNALKGVRISYEKVYRVKAQPTVQGKKCLGVDRLVRFYLGSTTTTEATTPTTETTSQPTTESTTEATTPPTTPPNFEVDFFTTPDLPF
jgi:hypothetical protein